MAVRSFKSTLMQIWKSPYIFVSIWKQYPKNFRFLVQRILELLTLEVCNVLKSRLIFNIFYCFSMFVNKFFIYLTCAYLKSKRCFDVKSSTYYFHMKTKILADFQICINFPLRYISNDLSVQLAKYLLKLLAMIFESKIFLILRMRCFAICLTNSNNLQ